MVADLRTNRDIAPTPAVANSDAVLQITGRLLVAEAVCSHRQFLGDVLHGVILPNELVARMVIRLAVGGVHDVLKF